jgi:quercetin dioxygenase-like cupin family protein
MALHVKREDIKERRRIQPGGGHGAMGVRKAYGNECSLMIASRPPGYHSKPHRHASDQIIYVLEGEHWFFVENQGFHCKKGDFVRIPANGIQWDWNRSDAESVVVETHSPPMIGGPSGDGAIPLFDEGEKPQVQRVGVNVYVDHDFEAVERKYNLL